MRESTGLHHGAGQPAAISKLAINMLTLGMSFTGFAVRQTQRADTQNIMMLLEISVPDFDHARGRGLSLPARPKIKITGWSRLGSDSTGLNVLSGCKASIM